MTTTSKSRSRAWRAMARETWPPPATTSCGRLVTGSTRSSWRVVERERPGRCRGASARSRRRGPARPAGRAQRAEHPAAGEDQHARLEAQGAALSEEERHERHGRSARAAAAAAATTDRCRRPAAGQPAPRPRSARIHMVPPQTRPVFQASSSVSWYSRSDAGWPARTLLRRDRWRRLRRSRRRACRAAARPRRPSSTSLAPTTCGVLPWVRTTVATANGMPAAASSCMRAKGDAMVLGAIGGAGSRGVRTPHGQSNTSSARS